MAMVAAGKSKEEVLPVPPGAQKIMDLAHDAMAKIKGDKPGIAADVKSQLVSQAKILQTESLASGIPVVDPVM